MQCQICKKDEATIHLTEITDGIRTEMHLCERCAAEQGVSVKSQMSINELLGSLLAAAPADEEMADPSQRELVCPDCGFTLEHFRKEAVLGCPGDYDVFEKQLLGLIEKAHDGNSCHCGKIPSKTSVVDRKEVEVLSLRQRLEAAVKAENYELAAELRDKIAEAER